MMVSWGFSRPGRRGCGHRFSRPSSIPPPPHPRFVVARRICHNVNWLLIAASLSLSLSLWDDGRCLTDLCFGYLYPNKF